MKDSGARFWDSFGIGLSVTASGIDATMDRARMDKAFGISRGQEAYTHGVLCATVTQAVNELTAIGALDGEIKYAISCNNSYR